ncbi:MAG: glycosyltransferase family 4 protein [Candidatus Omnitrophica bacterium]|nr:glycosyltransferase family 4 protein [Candidatus Omnitrophota bacterium]
MLKGLQGRLAGLNNVLLDWRLITNKFDIYHPTYYSCAVKKKRGVKLVVTVHDMIHELFLSGLPNFQHDLVVKRQSINSADHIICVSNNTKRDLQQIYNIDEELISVIYHGAPVESKKTIAEQYALPEKPYVFYVGKRSGYKNFSVLLQAFAMQKVGSELDLVCFGGGRFTSVELAEFKELELENKIKYVEGPEELLQSYYKRAKLLVYPSRYEGFGFPPLEAMAFGCPVVAANTASIPEVTDGAALLFSPDNAEELCNCIKSTLNDNRLRQSKIASGLKRAQDFSWEKTAHQTYDLYRKLLS